jgi:PKD repeat protein
MQGVTATFVWLTGVAMSAAFCCMSCSRDSSAPAAGTQPATVATATSGSASAPGDATAAELEKLLLWADADPDEGEAPLATLLTADPLEDIEEARYSWDFGDGSPGSNEQNPKHTYGRPGEYTARVQVTDKHGNRGSDEVLVTVEAPEGRAPEGRAPEGAAASEPGSEASLPEGQGKRLD